MTLHVEEPYRGKGLAKTLARRLMRDHLKDYGDDGWGAADVFVSNMKSQAVCKSLGGTLSWIVSWYVVYCRGRRKELTFGKGSFGSRQRGGRHGSKRAIIQKHHAHIDIVDFLYIFS